MIGTLALRDLSKEEAAISLGRREPGLTYCGSKDTGALAQAPAQGPGLLSQVVVLVNALDTKINVQTQHAWATSGPQTQYDQQTSSSPTHLQAAPLHLASQMRNWDREGTGQVMDWTAEYSKV